MRSSGQGRMRRAAGWAAALATAMAAAGLAGCAASVPAPVLLSLPHAAAGVAFGADATTRAPAEGGIANGVDATSAAHGADARQAAGTAGAGAASGGSTNALLAAAPAPVLVVRRVAIPEYLSSRRVRYRADPSTLAEWPNTFWAERIEIGVTREFVAALRARLPGWTICDASCDDRLPAVSLLVELAPLDYLRPQQQLVAQARVTLSTAQGEARLLQTREQGFSLKSSGDTPQAEAQALTQLLHEVAALTAPAVTAAASAALAK